MTEPNAEATDKSTAVGPSPMDRRNAAFEAINESRTKILKAGGLIVDDPDDVTDPPDPDAEADPEKGAKAPDKAAEDEGGDDPGVEEGAEPDAGTGDEDDDEGQRATPAAADEPTYKVLVDGEERTVTLSEMTRAYQLAGAAENRLNMASEVLRRVENIRDSLRRGEPIDDDAEPAGGKAKPAAKKADAKGGDDPLEGIDFKEIVRKFQYDSPEDGAEALKNLVIEVTQRANGGAAPSSEEITRSVIDHVNFTTALRQFGEDYSDIVTDPYLAQRTGAKTNELYLEAVQAYRTHGTPVPSYTSLFTKAGDDTRAWLKQLAEGHGKGPDSEAEAEDADPPTPTPASTMQNRIDRKRGSPQPPAGRSRQPSAAKDKETPTVPSVAERSRSGIADLQKARGQAA